MPISKNDYPSRKPYKAIPLTLASLYLLSQVMPYSVALANPDLISRPGAGVSRIPLQVMSFNAPGFGDIQDAINVANGNVYLDIGELSRNNVTTKTDTQDMALAKYGNWNVKNRYKLLGVNENFDPFEFNQNWKDVSIPPSQLILESGDGSTRKFIRVARDSVPTTAPSWIKERYAALTEPTVYFYQLIPEAGSESEDEWTVLVEKNNAIYAHYYDHIGTRMTFYTDGPYADYLQTLDQQYRSAVAEDPEGSVDASPKTKFVYLNKAKGWLSDVIDEFKHTTTYTWDAVGEKITRIDYKPDGVKLARQTVFTYDSKLGEQNLLDSVTFKTTDGKRALDTTSTPLNLSRTFRFNYGYYAFTSTNNVTSNVPVLTSIQRPITTGNATTGYSVNTYRTTTYTYKNVNNGVAIGTVKEDGNATTTYTYGTTDAVNSQVAGLKITTEQTDGKTTKKSEYHYDVLGRLRKRVLYNPQNTQKIPAGTADLNKLEWRYEYYNNGLLAVEVEPALKSAKDDVLRSKTTHYTYDTRGNLIRTTVHEGNPFSTDVMARPPQQIQLSVDAVKQNYFLGDTAVFKAAVSNDPTNSGIDWNTFVPILSNLSTTTPWSGYWLKPTLEQGPEGGIRLKSADSSPYAYWIPADSRSISGLILSGKLPATKYRVSFEGKVATASGTTLNIRYGLADAYTTGGTLTPEWKTFTAEFTVTGDTDRQFQIFESTLGNPDWDIRNIEVTIPSEPVANANELAEYGLTGSDITNVRTLKLPGSLPTGITQLIINEQATSRKDPTATVVRPIPVNFKNTGITVPVPVGDLVPRSSSAMSVRYVVPVTGVGFDNPKFVVQANLAQDATLTNAQKTSLNKKVNWSVTGGNYTQTSDNTIEVRPQDAWSNSRYNPNQVVDIVATSDENPALRYKTQVEFRYFNFKWWSKAPTGTVSSDRYHQFYVVANNVPYWKWVPTFNWTSSNSGRASVDSSGCVKTAPQWRWDGQETHTITAALNEYSPVTSISHPLTFWYWSDVATGCDSPHATTTGVRLISLGGGEIASENAAADAETYKTYYSSCNAGSIACPQGLSSGTGSNSTASNDATNATKTNTLSTAPAMVFKTGSQVFEPEFPSTEQTNWYSKTVFEYNKDNQLIRTYEAGTQNSNTLTGKVNSVLGYDYQSITEKHNLNHLSDTTLDAQVFKLVSWDTIQTLLGGSEDGTTVGTLVRKTTENYDTLNRVTSNKLEWDSKFKTTTYTYPDLAVAAPSKTITYYNGSYSTRSVAQPMDLASVIKTTTSDGLSFEQQFAYDEFGNTAETLSVGALANVLSGTTDTAGQTVPQFTDLITKRAFNGFGELFWEGTKDGATAGTFTTEQGWDYTVNGDVTKMWQGSPDNVTVYGFDSFGRVNVESKGAGYANSSFIERQKTTFTFDDFDRVVSKTVTFGGKSYTSRTAYTALDEVMGELLPDGSGYEQQFDASGQVKEKRTFSLNPAVKPDTASTQLSTTNGSWEFGPVKSIQTWVHNPMGWTTSTQLMPRKGVTGTPVLRTEYGYDSKGQVIAERYSELTTETATTGTGSINTNDADRTSYSKFSTEGQLLLEIGPKLRSATGTAVIADGRCTASSYTYDKLNRQTEQRVLLEGSPTCSVTEIQTQLAGANVAVTSKQYDGLDRVIKTTDPEGYTTDTAYDLMGNPIKTTQLYYKAGAESQENPDGYTTLVSEMAYNAAGKVIALKNPAGDIQRTAYNKLGQVTLQGDFEGYISTINQYTSDGLLQGVFLPSIGVARVPFSPTQTSTASFTQVQSNQYTYNAVQSPFPLAVTTRLPNDKTNAAGTTGLANITTHEYNHQGKVSKTTIQKDPNDPQSVDAVSTQVYDEDGNVTEQVTPEGFKTVFSYDYGGHLLTKTELARTSTTTESDAGLSAGLSYEYRYDAYGNLIWKKERGLVTEYKYNSLGKVIAESRPRTDSVRTWKAYAYRLDGNKVIETSFIYDASTSPNLVFNASPIQATESNGVAYQKGNLRVWELDKLGNITKEFSEGTTTPDKNGNTTFLGREYLVEFKYNGLGLKTKRIFQGDPLIYAQQRDDNGLPISVNQKASTAYNTYWQYNKLGLLSKSFDVVLLGNLSWSPARNIFEYTYDKNGRELKNKRNVMVKVVSPGGATVNGTTQFSVAKTMLAATVGETNTTYNERGLVKTTIVTDQSPRDPDPKSTTDQNNTFDTDAEQLETAPIIQTTTYTYYADGSKKTVGVNRGGTIGTKTFTYDHRGRETRVVDSNGNMVMPTNEELQGNPLLSVKFPHRFFTGPAYIDTAYKADGSYTVTLSTGSTGCTEETLYVPTLGGLNAKQVHTSTNCFAPSTSENTEPKTTVLSQNAKDVGTTTNKYNSIGQLISTTTTSNGSGNSLTRTELPSGYKSSPTGPLIYVSYHNKSDGFGNSYYAPKEEQAKIEKELAEYKDYIDYSVTCCYTTSYIPIDIPSDYTSTTTTTESFTYELDGQLKTQSQTINLSSTANYQEPQTGTGVVEDPDAPKDPAVTITKTGPIKTYYGEAVDWNIFQVKRVETRSKSNSTSNTYNSDGFLVKEIIPSQAPCPMKFEDGRQVLDPWCTPPNVTNEYVLDSQGKRLTFNNNDTNANHKFVDYLKRYDADQRVGMFFTEKDFTSKWNHFVYDPAGQQVLSSTGGIQQYTIQPDGGSTYNMAKVVRSFNSTYFSGNSVQMIRHREGNWSFRYSPAWRFLFWETKPEGLIWTSTYDTNKTNTAFQQYKDETYSLADGQQDKVQWSGVVVFDNAGQGETPIQEEAAEVLPESILNTVSTLDVKPVDAIVPVDAPLDVKPEKTKSPTETAAKPAQENKKPVASKQTSDKKDGISSPEITTFEQGKSTPVVTSASSTKEKQTGDAPSPDGARTNSTGVGVADTTSKGEASVEGEEDVLPGVVSSATSGVGVQDVNTSTPITEVNPTTLSGAEISLPSVGANPGDGPEQIHPSVSKSSDGTSNAPAPEQKAQTHLFSNLGVQYNDQYGDTANQLQAQYENLLIELRKLLEEGNQAKIDGFFLKLEDSIKQKLKDPKQLNKFELLKSDWVRTAFKSGVLTMITESKDVDPLTRLETLFTLDRMFDYALEDSMTRNHITSKILQTGMKLKTGNPTTALQSFVNFMWGSYSDPSPMPLPAAAYGLSTGDTPAAHISRELALMAITGGLGSYAGKKAGSPCNSFTADTVIHTENGLKEIALALVGEKVLAFNEKTGKEEYQPISQIFMNTDPELTILGISDPESGQMEFITTTPEHPFYVSERSDGESRPKPEGHPDLSEKWVGAGHLKIGDKVKQADGTLGEVRYVNIIQESRTMYNLEVEEAHTFFVGIQGWLVHNGGLDWCQILKNKNGKSALPKQFYDNIYRKVTPAELKDADKFVRADGKVLDGHPTKHSMPKTKQAEILNNWDRMFTGVNENGRPVDIFYKDGMVVITQAGDKSKVITAYGGMYSNDKKPLPISKWTDPRKWDDGVFYWSFKRSKDR